MLCGHSCAYICVRNLVCLIRGGQFCIRVNPESNWSHGINSYKFLRIVFIDSKFYDANKSKYFPFQKSFMITQSLSLSFLLFLFLFSSSFSLFSVFLSFSFFYIFSFSFSSFFFFPLPFSLYFFFLSFSFNYLTIYLYTFVSHSFSLFSLFFFFLFSVPQYSYLSFLFLISSFHFLSLLRLLIPFHFLFSSPLLHFSLFSTLASSSPLLCMFIYLFPHVYRAVLYSSLVFPFLF